MVRKGARSIKEIPEKILDQLNSGKIETANLMEWLAINQQELLKNILDQLDRSTYLDPILADIEGLKKLTITSLNKTIGTGLYTQASLHDDKEILKILSTHISDSVRCWAAFSIGANPSLSIQEMLHQIKPFAADKHFGVREVSWLAIRPLIAKNLKPSLNILSKWAWDEDENIRRFASESTRPRGVWTEHIETLKQDPSLGLTILESLKSDLSKYVQNSVGNWLNDASKSQPDFVLDICKKWKKENPTKETLYIIQKALRTITKK